jgi:hypothetical protein
MSSNHVMFHQIAGDVEIQAYVSLWDKIYSWTLLYIPSCSQKKLEWISTPFTYFQLLQLLLSLEIQNYTFKCCFLSSLLIHISKIDCWNNSTVSSRRPWLCIFITNYSIYAIKYLQHKIYVILLNSLNFLHTVHMFLMSSWSNGDLYNVNWLCDSILISSTSDHGIKSECSHCFIKLPSCCFTLHK